MKSFNDYGTINKDYTIKQQNDDAFESTIKEERKRQKNIFAGNDINYSKNMRYQQEKIKPSQDTMKVQSTLNDYGYTDQQGKKLKVDGAYGPKTDYAFNNAYNTNKSVFENREKQRKRNEIVPFLSSAYDPLVQKANSRKLNMPKDEVVKTKQFLNQFGYTDMHDKPLVENDVWDNNTKMAFEKYVWDGIPRQEVLDLQKSLNKNGITDKDGNPLLEDGKLGRKTDGAVHNALRTLGGNLDTGIKRGDTLRFINKNEINDKTLNQTRYIGDIPIETNNLYASTTISDTNATKYVGEPVKYSKLNDFISNATDAVKSAIDSVKSTIDNSYEKFQGTKVYDYIEEYKPIAAKYDIDTANKASYYSIFYENAADKYAKDKNLKDADGNEHISYNNEADAFRHSMWNATMTRNLGSEVAKFVTDNHEIKALKDLGWLESFEDGVVKAKVNQPVLMDLWNNSVGRTLGLDPALSNMDDKELMNHALYHNMLITDATKTYEFYGITEYITDVKDWAVDIEWNTNDNTIVVKKEGMKDLKLLLGRFGD